MFDRLKNVLKIYRMKVPHTKYQGKQKNNSFIKEFVK